MTKSTKTIIEKALRHYDEMIEWAKEQNPRDASGEDTMYVAIEQDWFSDSCPLCKRFNKYKPEYGYTCGECPLYAKYGLCGAGNSTSAWKKMRAANTWKTWIRHATRMREQIESLLKEVKPDAK